MNVLEYEDTSEINTRVAELQGLWRTEANSPELLTYNEAVVNEIRQMIKEQQV